MSKKVSIDEFIELFDDAVERYKNTNNPIPELKDNSLSYIKGFLEMPFQSFGGVDLFPTIYDKAAKMLYEIDKGHKLGNGNKRMAYTTAMYFLYKNGVIVKIPQDEAYKMLIHITISESKDSEQIMDEIKTILKKYTMPTLQEFQVKLAAAKKNSALNDKQREMLIKHYNEQIDKLKGAEKPAEPKKEVKEKPVKKEAKPKAEEKVTKKEEPEKKESKKIDYNCDELIEEAKERHKRAKEAAEKRAEAPKKTEVTKSKEKIEKAHDAIHKQVEAGKFGKAQLQKLRAETKELLDFIDKALKNL